MSSFRLRSVHENSALTTTSPVLPNEQRRDRVLLLLALASRRMRQASPASIAQIRLHSALLGLVAPCRPTINTRPVPRARAVRRMGSVKRTAEGEGRTIRGDALVLCRLLCALCCPCCLAQHTCCLCSARPTRCPSTCWLPSLSAPSSRLRDQSKPSGVCACFSASQWTVRAVTDDFSMSSQPMRQPSRYRARRHHRQPGQGLVSYSGNRTFAKRCSAGSALAVVTSTASWEARISGWTRPSTRSVRASAPGSSLDFLEAAFDLRVLKQYAFPRSCQVQQDMCDGVPFLLILLLAYLRPTSLVTQE